MTCKEKIIKREGEGGRERQPIHGEIMIREQKAKEAVTLAVAGRVKSGFIDMWLVNKNKGDNYVGFFFFTLVGSFPGGALCHGSK